MNEKNFDYLKDNVKYLGFGEKLHEALAQHLGEGKDSFQLVFQSQINKKNFEAVLQFRKSNQSDMYFLNSYNATLERSNGQKMEQTFYLHNGRGVTAKEAFNLLEGRAVFKELTNKEGDPYKAWIQLDFGTKDKHNNHEVKQFHENYGYDLKAAVAKYPVVEMDGGEKEKALLQSLQKGNVQSITIERNGIAEKLFMEANPQYKTTTLYDAEFKRVPKETLELYTRKEMSAVREPREELKQEVAPDKKKSLKEKPERQQEGSKKKSSRKRGLSM